MAEENMQIRDDSSDDDEQKKKKSGGCSGKSSSSQSSSDSASGAEGDGDGSSSSSSGGLKVGDTDESVNQMCKKTYTIYRSIPKDYSCPTAQRDNVSDQFTPQDDLIVMEKTVRDFLKLESKIYDAESTNPRFFASEDWIKHYEKDKNTVLALMDQYKANILRMEHLYTVVDYNSLTKLKSIPNQDNKSSFQTNIQWKAQALKDWANNWFIKKSSSCCTKLYNQDYWQPSLTGQMIQWMKLGTYKEATQVRPIGIETMIAKVDRLECWIDRLMTPDTVNQTIAKNVNMKETLEQKAKQTNEQAFTSKIIDSQMGKKLGVTSTGTTNEKTEGTTYVAPKEDSVEDVTLTCKLSCVKKLFKELREKSLDAMKSCRCVSQSGPGPFPQIWTNIDTLAAKVYADLTPLNTLIQDLRQDSENPGKHCSITHTKLCPIQLNKKIQAFKCVIKQGVIDVMTNQAMLPKKGLNILDSMFNQLWEYGEKGPTIDLPSWCKEAIDAINGFEDSMIDAYDEVFDCWEREFLTRLWHIELDHHTDNYIRQQDQSVCTTHDHTHPVVCHYSGTALPSPGGDSYNFDTTPLKGHLVCTNHLSMLLAPVCVCYRTNDIANVSKNYRPDVKELCAWMVSAIKAIGIKQAAISAVMSDPSLNGNCGNKPYLEKINDLRTKNHNILAKVEHAYGIYSDVNNMKNKQDYQDEISRSELQPSQYSNEDQLNMTSSLQSETDENDLTAELCQGGIDICALKPWNHLNLSVDKVEPDPIPSKCVCNKFEKIIKSVAGFESVFGSGD